MLISPAFAHGTGGGGSEVGPLILPAIAVVFGLVYLGRKKWRSRNAVREGSGK
jgi:hypothetical protein